MTTPVTVIGLDAADPELVEEWMASGDLPVLSALQAGGAYGRLENLDFYKAETPWTTFLTGRLPEQTGYWSPVQLVEGTYDVADRGAYDFGEVPPFFALGDDYRVAVFDVPQVRLNDRVNGPQVLAWGAHSPQTDSESSPPGLLQEVIRKHGEHPALHRDHGDWWDGKYLKGLHRNLLTGIERRANVCRDWLGQERWDLFLTVFGETHSAGHDFWHLSRKDSPLYGRLPGVFDGDPLLDVFQATDKAVGDIFSAAPEDGYRIVFSVHGSDNNTTDVSSMALLPEFLYRYSFPGKFMLAPGRSATRVPSLKGPIRMQHWQHDLRAYTHDPNDVRRLLKRFAPPRLHNRINKLFGGRMAPDLHSIQELKSKGVSLAWQPTQWYSKAWPKMKAFALPSFSEGYVRINLKGREPSGIVEPQDYEAVCNELTAELERLVNPRNGQRVVKKVVRTRATLGDNGDPHLPDADLVVVWSDDPADVVDHPTVGRIGPVPYRRTGSHRARGFWMIQGPGIQPGSRMPPGHAVDLPATILECMGVPGAGGSDANPLWRRPAMSAG